MNSAKSKAVKGNVPFINKDAILKLAEKRRESEKFHVMTIRTKSSKHAKIKKLAELCKCSENELVNLMFDLALNDI